MVVTRWPEIVFGLVLAPVGPGPPLCSRKLPAPPTKARPWPPSGSFP